MKHTHAPLLALATVVAAAAACTTDGGAARADSLNAVAAEQLRLMNQLSAQKDSLTGVVLDADDFISQIDSQISTVKGLPKKKRREPLESPIQEQLLQRKEMLERVTALVERTKATAAQLAEARKREQELKGENADLRAQIERDQQTITALGDKVQEQATTILTLSTRVDSLITETRAIGQAHYRAFYIVGTERQLMEKGIIVKEGGANLLVARVGRTLQPARVLRSQYFTEIDQRDVREIQVPDTSRRYRIVSRQSLDNATVAARDEATFQGDLRITDAARFWAPSRFLIIVEQ